MSIPFTEFARRVCAANHPGDTIERACGTHQSMAERMYGLIKPSGERTLGVIIEARLEDHLAVPGLAVGEPSEPHVRNAATVE